MPNFMVHGLLKIRWGVLVTVLFLVASRGVFAATVEGIRLWRAPDHTRLVFDLSDSANHTLFTLHDPARLVVDISNTRLAADISSLDFSDTPIVRMRTGMRDSRDLRIVLDLSQKIHPKSFPLAGNEQYGDRLVVDLYDKVKENTKSVDDVIAPETRDRPIVIAIDAGHGGEDPGAMGSGRIREKEVVLAISKLLAGIIDQEKGFEAKLVRSGDYYIPLRGRTSIARDKRADLFVSVHADAFTRQAARGASVFALSSSGATSETARYLAQKENQADLIGGVGDVNLKDKDEMLASVLLDLSMTATLDSSLDVGKSVLSQIGRIARLHKKHVEQAGFVVLKSPDIPSILVETGFISNPTEARQLADRAYQRRMAQAIFAGIRNYFYSKPPPGTWVASNAKRDSGDVYIIARGDTLSGIAARYNVSVEALKRHNGMTSSVIRVGQRLRIPTS